MESRRIKREVRAGVDKTALIQRMQATRAEVMAIIESLPEEVLVARPNADGWTVKDILAHLARWEGELVTLLWQLSQGQTPNCVMVQNPLPVNELNQEWHEADRDRPLVRILSDLAAVRRQTLVRLSEFAEEDLEREDLAPELRGIALWHRVAANTFEHDEEHLEDLRQRAGQ